MTETMLPMPKYRSHKIVRAAEIRDVNASAGFVTIANSTMVGGPDHTVHVPARFWADEHKKPKPGDYLTQYEPDGYLSWSPKAVFEAGNAPVDEGDKPETMKVSGTTRTHLYADEPDARQAGDITPTLFRPRYRKLKPSEVTQHDRIKTAAETLALEIAALNPSVYERLVLGPAPIVVIESSKLLGKTYDAAGVTLAFRHLEDAVYRAIKALTA